MTSQRLPGAPALTYLMKVILSEQDPSARAAVSVVCVARDVLKVKLRIGAHAPQREASGRNYLQVKAAVVHGA